MCDALWIRYGRSGTNRYGWFAIIGVKTRQKYVTKIIPRGKQALVDVIPVVLDQYSRELRLLYSNRGIDRVSIELYIFT